MKTKTVSRLLWSLILVVIVCGCNQRQERAMGDVSSSNPAAAAPSSAQDQGSGAMAVASAPSAVLASSPAADTNFAKPSSPQAAARMPAKEAAPQEPAQVAQQLSSSATTYADGHRQFVRTADIDFSVKDVYRSALAVEDMAESVGGFVIKNEIHAETGRSVQKQTGDGNLVELTEYTVRGTLQVRVPSTQTQTFLRNLATQVVFLNQRNFQARDVELDILRQRLTAQRAQEAQQALGQLAANAERIRQREGLIYAQGDAKGVRDDAELARQDFADKVAFSTISITLTQPAQIRRSEWVDFDAVQQQNRPSVHARLAQALSSGWHSLLNVLIALAEIWPLGLLVGAGGLFAYRVRRAAQRKLAIKAQAGRVSSED